MKKKHREITVEGVKYTWTVRDKSIVTIFKDKKVIYEDCACNGEEITPAIIRAAIFVYLDKPKLVGIIHMLTRYESNYRHIEWFQEQNAKYLNILYSITDANTI